MDHQESPVVGSSNVWDVAANQNNFLWDFGLCHRFQIVRFVSELEIVYNKVAMMNN